MMIIVLLLRQHVIGILVFLLQLRIVSLRHRYEFRYLKPLDSTLYCADTLLQLRALCAGVGSLRGLAQLQPCVVSAATTTQ